MASLNRIGAGCSSVVIVPSGFAHVVDVSDRIASTSTLEPCDRAETTADTRSGRDATLATGGFGSAAGAATAGSLTSKGCRQQRERNHNGDRPTGPTARTTACGHDENQTSLTSA